MFYRLYFKLTLVIFMVVAIVITALWPHMYSDFDGFGFHINGIGGYHVQWHYPIGLLYNGDT